MNEMQPVMFQCVLYAIRCHTRDIIPAFQNKFMGHDAGISKCVHSHNRENSSFTLSGFSDTVPNLITHAKNALIMIIIYKVTLPSKSLKKSAIDPVFCHPVEVPRSWLVNPNLFYEIRPSNVCTVVQSSHYERRTSTCLHLPESLSLEQRRVQTESNSICLAINLYLGVLHQELGSWTSVTIHGAKCGVICFGSLRWKTTSVGCLNLQPTGWVVLSLSFFKMWLNMAIFGA